MLQRGQGKLISRAHIKTRVLNAKCLTPIRNYHTRQSEVEYRFSVDSRRPELPHSFTSVFKLTRRGPCLGLGLLPVSQIADSLPHSMLTPRTKCTHLRYVFFCFFLFLTFSLFLFHSG